MTLIRPTGLQALGQAKLILKGAGLGFVKPKFLVYDFDKAAIEATAYDQIEQVGYDKKGGLFGLPIWDTVTLIAPAYTDDSGNGIGVGRFQLDIAIIEVSNDRNIVKTKIAGRNGTIKEYMSDGDFDVSIKGSLVNEYANIPPYNLIHNLDAISKCPETLSVESNLLNHLNIFNLVIEDYTLKQRQGARNIYDFELQCVSDTPFDLDVTA